MNDTLPKWKCADALLLYNLAFRSSSLHFTSIPSVYKFIALTKSPLRNASLPAFLWVSAIAEIKIQTELFWVLPVWMSESQRTKHNIWCLANCTFTWRKDRGHDYKCALCLDFTYICDEKILGLLVDFSPLLLDYHLPVLKCVRILWKNKSLSPTDPGCSCQSYKS